MLGRLRHPVLRSASFSVCFTYPSTRLTLLRLSVMSRPINTAPIPSTSVAPSNCSKFLTKVPPAEPSQRYDSSDAITPTVYGFFEKETSTWQYVAVDPRTLEAVVIDPVLDYDPSSGKVSTSTADGLLAFMEHNNISVRRILETHAHADHLTAAQYLKQQLGGDVAVCIGEKILQVQQTFAPIYGFDHAAFANTFDIFLKDDEEFKLGDISCRVMHLPGHTPDHLGYVMGKAVFTGDSIFNVSAVIERCLRAQNFLAALTVMIKSPMSAPPVQISLEGVSNIYTPYAFRIAVVAVLVLPLQSQSMQRLLSFPEDHRLFVGHDYPEDRSPSCSATVAEQRASNKHMKDGTEETSFTQWRHDRDAVLGAPRLLHPALQVNVRAGKLPPRDAQGRLFLMTPVKVDPQIVALL
ncbi:Glyoxylase B2 [Grifola frondosa]|uniref:Glyoxylase B2 n=1 Tax=Grifola frondosa TaxID=5627 RepID=A0A1C7LVM8_GRIFR|nr:Glyoxylase B2 [Grifola frondosa]